MHIRTITAKRKNNRVAHYIFAGKLIEKRVILSVSVRSEKEHPCLRSISEMRVSPRPLPERLVEKKGLNRCRSVSSDMG